MVVFCVHDWSHCLIQDDRGSSHSATETEEAAVVTNSVDSTQEPAQAMSDHQTTESGSEREGGGGNREKRKVTTSKRGKSRKSAVSSRKTAAETHDKGDAVNEERRGVLEGNTAEGESLVRGEGEGGGDGKVANTNNYSPMEPVDTSPLRDTIKLGPVR